MSDQPTVDPQKTMSDQPTVDPQITMSDQPTVDPQITMSDQLFTEIANTIDERKEKYQWKYDLWVKSGSIGIGPERLCFCPGNLRTLC
jgi:hypothetical protein